MDYKMKVEYEILIKNGISHEIALLVVKAKYKKLDESTDEILYSLKDENLELSKHIKDFKEFNEK
jgi:hypothetical protein